MKKHFPLEDTIGTLGNYDNDGKRNVKKSSRFNEQNNNSVRHHAFSYN